MSHFKQTPRSRSHVYLPQHTTIDSMGPVRSTGRLRTTSAMNLPGLTERSFQAKRIPPKSTSFQISRDGPSTPLLPKYSEVSQQRHGATQIKFKAAERGRGDLLPRCAPSPQQGYSSDGMWSKLDSIKNIGQRLRSRRRTSSTESSRLDGSSHQWDPSRFERSGSFDQYLPDARKAKLHFNRIYPSKKREWLQLLIVSVVILLVTDSYRKAVQTTERLEHFQAEESMMMLHLQRIEQQWINLHERMSRFTSSNEEETGLQPVEIRAPEVVDSELIRVQTQQLYQMEEELDMELKSLQTKLQNVARASIVRTFGEGPVQVVLDLDFPEGVPAGHTSSISILLWYDTPHAAWTWLQQIQRGEWNGAMFEIGQSATIDAAPLLKNSGTIDFVEKSQKHHEAWTVGLTDNGGGLGMFINLQDNTEAKYHDVCVGKVIDGFDALQRLVDTTRHGQQNSVVIRQATSTHLTRQRPA